MLEAPDDGRLLAGAPRGDTTGFGSLYRRLAVGVHRYLACVPPEWRVDLLQAVFIAVWQAAPT